MILAVSIILSFIAVRGFRFNLTADGLALGNTESFAWLLLFFFFLRVLYLTFTEKDRARIITAGLFGLIIGIFYTLGLSFEKRGNLTWIMGSASYLVNYLNLFFSNLVLYYCFAYQSFRFIAKASVYKADRHKRLFSFKTVLLVWLGFMVFYILWYLFNYPGIITLDTLDQLKQAADISPLNDHHPVLLTLLMRAVILPVEKMTGSIQAGVGICSFLQMAVLTFVFALTYERILYYVNNRTLRALIFLAFAIYPVNSMYSVTLWKDILFSACLLLLLLCVDFIAEDAPAFLENKKNCFLLCLVLLLLLLTRHNGIVIVLAMTLVFVFAYPVYRKRLLCVCLGSLLLWAAFQYLLLPALRVTKLDSGLMLSLPNQQIARTLYYHNEEFTEDELEKINSYYTVPEVWRYYRPKLSDAVKDRFISERYEENRGEFLSLWMRLGLRYPGDYLEAFLHNCYGYWFPETNYWITATGVEAGAKEIGISSAPILQSAVISRINNFQMEQKFNKIPVLALFFKPGACWWVWMFCACFCLYRNKRKLILFVPGLMLWLPILFSPVYCEFRYVYGLFICLPLLLASTLTVRQADNAKNKTA